MISLKSTLTKILEAIAQLTPAITTAEAAANTTLASDTPASVASITLPAGTYLLTGTGRFDANADGYRELYFSATDGGNPLSRYGRTHAKSVSGHWMYIQVTATMQLASGATIYLVGNQDSGSSLMVRYAGISATKIG